MSMLKLLLLTGLLSFNGGALNATNNTSTTTTSTSTTSTSTSTTSTSTSTTSTTTTPYDIKTNYRLAATGYGPNAYPEDSKRFSSAFDTNFRIFRITHNDEDLNKTNGVLNECLDRCDKYEHCNGVFYTFGSGHDYSYCNGLSYLGKLSNTQKRSYSLTKIRTHNIYDPLHSISGYVKNEGELDNSSKVYIDINLNGKYDENEPLYETESDGYYEFINLPYFSYALMQESVLNCSQVYPTINGTNDIVPNVTYKTQEDGYPDKVLKYIDSGEGIMGGEGGGYPYGGKIETILNSEGKAIKDRVETILPEVILGNNVEYTMIIPKSSTLTLAFANELIVNKNNTYIEIKFLEALNDEDSIFIFLSEDNEDYTYLGVIDKDTTRLYTQLISNQVNVIRTVKIMGRSGMGITKGFPLINIYVNHEETTTIPWAHNVHLSHNNETDEQININFINICEIEEETSTSTTTSTTTSTSTSTTTSTTSTPTTRPTTTTSTTSTRTSTTTTPKNISSSEIDQNTSNSFNLLYLIPIIGSVIIFMILVYLGTYYYRIKQRRQRDLNINNQELAGMSFKNPLFVHPNETATYRDNVILNPSYDLTQP